MSNNDDLKRCTPLSYTQPTVIQTNPELPAMVDAACDILLASNEEGSSLESLDDVVREELIGEAAAFLISMFRRSCEWNEHVKKAHEMADRFHTEFFKEKA